MNEKLLTFGVINIDKPQGPTSYTITEYVKKTLGITKTSHMGTLDPNVTGVLPITLGRACRLAEHLIGHDKTYVGVMHTHKEQDIKELQELINKHFTGIITQTPPLKSAVKVAPRKRTVHYWKLKEAGNIIEGTYKKSANGKGKEFLFETKVEGGTYIRKLCSDLGEKTGGAHMEELRRTKAGIFDETTTITIEEFTKAAAEHKKGNNKTLQNMIIPAEKIIPKIMPTIQIEKRAIKSLHTGKPLRTKDCKETTTQIPKGTYYAAYNKEQLIGIYEKTEEKNTTGKPRFIYN